MAAAHNPAVVKDGPNGDRVVYKGVCVLNNPAPAEAVEVARALNGRLVDTIEHRQTAREIVKRHGTHPCNQILLKRERMVSVFVDQISVCFPTPSWPWMRSCRMFIDPSDDPQMSLDELHAFAKNVGILPEWFRGDHVMPYYMLTCSKRRVATIYGATPIIRPTFGDVMKMWQRVR